MPPPAAREAGAPPPRPVVGVKLYEAAPPYDGLFSKWRELGINTLFVSETLLRNADFRAQAAAQRPAALRHLSRLSEPRGDQRGPGTGRHHRRPATPARDEWVEFVCPAREDYLRRKVDQLKSLVADCDPYAVSLDFIRYFVFWEKVAPDRSPASLPQTCFCPVCLAGFEKEMGVALPAGLTSTAEKASWILGTHASEWTEWKCRTIARAVERLAKAAREVKPSVKVNLHAVPWRHDDFGGAVRSVAGQDLAPARSLRRPHLADVLSPHGPADAGLGP